VVSRTPRGPAQIKPGRRGSFRIALRLALSAPSTFAGACRERYIGNQQGDAIDYPEHDKSSSPKQT